MIFQRKLEVIRHVRELSSENSAIFATASETAKEALKIGDKKRIFFPCVGGMGHATSVAFGHAIQTKAKTICLDGVGNLC
jgi:thiamine pyrophosphate-dependent acetolactate synthase large subunit-like protein